MIQTEMPRRPLRSLTDRTWVVSLSLSSGVREVAASTLRSLTDLKGKTTLRANATTVTRSDISPVIAEADAAPDLALTTDAMTVEEETEETTTTEVADLPDLVLMREETEVTVEAIEIEETTTEETETTTGKRDVTLVAQDPTVESAREVVIELEEETVRREKNAHLPADLRSVVRVSRERLENSAAEVEAAVRRESLEKTVVREDALDLLPTRERRDIKAMSTLKSVKVRSRDTSLTMKASRLRSLVSTVKNTPEKHARNTHQHRRRTTIKTEFE